MLLNREFTWFFDLFHKKFHRNNVEAFQTLMFLSIANLFGYYNPKQLADYLNISHQRLYEHLKEFSLYSLKKMLIRFMVKLAAERIKSVLEKSNSTLSRAGISLTVDNSVIDSEGKMIRCTYSWYSGRWKKVVNGNDLLGIVLTIEGIVMKLHLLFCSKQGRGNTEKPSLLLSMFTVLIDPFNKEGIDITAFPVTLVSMFVSEELKQELHELGYKNIIIAGKSNYTFKINKKKQKASAFQDELKLVAGEWGIDVPACRVKGQSPTFGDVVLCLEEKSTTRTYYLMDFSETPHRGAEIWHIWKQHHIIEFFWKMLKSVFKINSRKDQGDGLYAGLLVKVLSYLLAIRLKGLRSFSKMSLVQIMRKLQREYNIETLAIEHFHL